MAREFLRLERFIGIDNVELLKTKKIALVGVGAVGGFCLEALSRSAIGSFTLCDFDTVEESNINRQILALHSTVGKSKVALAKERVLDINSDAKVKALNYFADNTNYDEIFDGADLIIDAIDSLSAKVSLLEAAYKRGLPVISSMGAALRRNPELIRVADIYDSYGCPLARQVRSMLRKRDVGRGIDVVFSPEKVRFNYIRVEDDKDIIKSDKTLDRGRDRVMLGSLSTVTAIFGLRLAHLALEKLLPESTLSGTAEYDPRA